MVTTKPGYRWETDSKGKKIYHWHGGFPKQVKIKPGEGVKSRKKSPKSKKAKGKIAKGKTAKKRN